MGVTLMNTTTAEVIAAPWLDKTVENKVNYKELINYNFVNHPIGSCFKPLLMFATYCKYPMLSKLKLNTLMISSINDFAKAERGQPQIDAKILNYPTKGFNGHSNVVDDDLNYALAHSSNLYPAINFLYSLTENPTYRNDILDGSPFPSFLYNGNGTEHSIACRVVSNQLYANRITETTIPFIYRQVYNVEDKDILANDRDLFDYNYWDKNYFVSYDVNNNVLPSKKLTNYSFLSPERVSLHFDLFRNNRATNLAGNFRNEVVPWVLGSQNNRWNNVKLCEGFCRLLTGNNIRGSFLPATIQANQQSIFSIISSQGYPTIQNFQTAHLDLLRALNYSTNPRQAQIGTWHDEGLMVSRIQIPGIDSSFVMLAKTGTSDDEIVPNNNNLTRQNNFKTVHRGAFMFCIMTQSQFLQLTNYINSGYNANSLPHKLGVTGVISLELADKGEESDIYYSAYARQFLTSNNSFVRNLILLNKNLFSAN